LITDRIGVIFLPANLNDILSSRPSINYITLKRGGEGRRNVTTTVIICMVTSDVNVCKSIAGRDIKMALRCDILCGRPLWHANGRSLMI